MTSRSTPPFLLLGRVLRPHGIRGELRIELMTAYPDRLVPDRHVYVGTNPDDPSSATLYTVRQARKHQQFLILQLDGINDRNAAEPLRQQYVMVTFDEAVPLEDDEFYLFQLIGLDVYTTEDELLGSVVDIIETGANDVYVVHGDYGEVLLPAIDECIVEMDFDAGRLTVRLMDGLLKQ